MYTYFIIHVYTFNGLDTRLSTTCNINGQTKSLTQFIFHKRRCNSSNSLFKEKKKKEKKQEDLYRQ